MSLKLKVVCLFLVKCVVIGGDVNKIWQHLSAVVASKDCCRA